MSIVLEVTPLLLIGLSLVLAFIGAEAMKRAGIPQILGFMLTGFFLGALGIFGDELRSSLFPLVELALGLIGYNIGLEIRKEIFKGHVKQMSLILIMESILTFALVSILAYFVLAISGIASTWGINPWFIAIIFGALASATDPASTVMVIWERHCKGKLTDTLMFVLALDDVIAILLANVTIAIAISAFSVSGTVAVSETLLITLFDVVASSALGAIVGASLVYFINREDDRRALLEFELGMIILLVGLSAVLGLSSILSCMVFGYIVGNYVEQSKDPVSHTLKTVMAPVVMIFFVIVGASIDLAQITGLASIILAVVYVAGRSFAKYAGSYAGALIAKMPRLTTKYIGFCLMSQAGVAVGLSLVIEEAFLGVGSPGAQAAGILILNIVALTTMILQIFGPISASEGLRKAGEYPDFLESGHTEMFEFYRRCIDCPMRDTVDYDFLGESTEERLDDMPEDYRT
ncbi:MAG: conserved membrane protein of unknown function [Candidatus Thorarchaeota archaeon]|nr:MAG: conserved membrane protein of unknown function [Candidatus Thorarchaeota archaeon]